MPQKSRESQIRDVLLESFLQKVGPNSESFSCTNRTSEPQTNHPILVCTGSTSVTGSCNYQRCMTWCPWSSSLPQQTPKAGAKVGHPHEKRKECTTFRSPVSNLQWVCANCERKAAGAAGGSYAELFTQKAVDVFVSHWWGHEFSEFVKALEHAVSLAARYSPGQELATTELWNLTRSATSVKKASSINHSVIKPVRSK